MNVCGALVAPRLEILNFTPQIFDFPFSPRDTTPETIAELVSTTRNGINFDTNLEKMTIDLFLSSKG